MPNERVDGYYQNEPNVMYLDFQPLVPGHFQIFADYWVVGTAHGVDHDNGFIGQMIEAVNDYLHNPDHGKEVSPWHQPDDMQPLVAMAGYREFRSGEFEVVGNGSIESMYAASDYAFNNAHLRWSEIIHLKGGEPVHLMLKWSNRHADPKLVNQEGHDQHGMCFQGIFYPDP